GATASGKQGATSGYRAPTALPDGTILVAYAPSLQALDWQIVAVSPRDGSRRTLITGGAGKARVDAVLAYKSPPRALYSNRRQLVFGGAAGTDTAHAIVHMPDAPMVFTLLTGNLRRGRPLEQFRAAKSLVVYQENGCPAGPCSANANGIFESRMELGRTNLASDGSVRVRLPAKTGLVFELVDGNGKSVSKMGEEHQMGPGESISMGISAKLFDGVCGGCHGSISGEELDVAVTPDALTGASQSMSAGVDPVVVGP
ncbi:MAG: hypothetical protein NT062_11255, partial [Proteobacteria bacterium]|nr:hypothetical protein [Pseudomonadota bacterium]